MKVLTDLLAKRDATQDELEKLTAKTTNGEERSLKPDELARVEELLGYRDELDERITDVTAEERTNRTIAEARRFATPRSEAGSVSVKEPMVYGPNSGQSFFLDQINQTLFRTGARPNDGGAQARLSQWEHQLECEIAEGSKVGQVALRHVRESYRESGDNARMMVEEVRSRGRVALEHKEQEQRSVGTGGGTTAGIAGGGGAAVVSPVILLDQLAPYREFDRPFADECDQQELPDYGMTIYIPAVTGPAGVTSQTEAGAVGETDPTLGFRSSTVVTNAGQVTVTQQLLDRAGPGFAFDKLIWDQLRRDYDQTFDKYVIAQSLAGATSVVWAGNAGVFTLTTTSGSGGFQGQVQKAAGAMEELAGTVTTPTHLWTWPSRWRFIESYSDSTGRPVIVPNVAGPMNALGAGSNGDARPYGDTGYKFGGISAFKDRNIPVPGVGTDQALLADMSQIKVFEGAQNTRVLPQTLGANLQVILQMYTYGAALPLYPGAVTAISGTGMSAITYTT